MSEPPPSASSASQPTVDYSSASAPAPHLRLLDALGRAVQQEPVRARRIFVNRTLRMDTVDVIGFDMDYTLALYNQPRIESLSVQCTLRKMIDHRGYPEEIQNVHYDPRFAIRGLVVDRQEGNILKMDRYGFVGRGYHGSRPLQVEERRALYRKSAVRLSHPRYAWIDTLFALPEAVLFGRIVDLLDRQQPGSPARYERLWCDIRESIDEAHRDESMKRIIKAQLDEYLIKDPDLASTLHLFRSSGKRLFLLTNSALDYTDRVMSFLLDGQLPGYPSWRSYFDAIVVDARKPTFFVDRAPLYELDAEGHPVAEVPAGTALVPGQVYKGGNVTDFGGQVGCTGDRVLYVGDHIYGDMLRAKKSSVWRTAMIIQELEEELQAKQQADAELRRVEALERRRHRVDAELRYQQMLLRHLEQVKEGEDPATWAEAHAEMEGRLTRLHRALSAAETEIEFLEEKIEHSFNPYWGPLFKEGAENSRFGEQVEDYACLYTSRVSNFLAYSPLQYFRSPRDHLPHERVY